MAQINRAVKTALLLLCPAELRRRLLEAKPNLRKAAPAGMQFQFDRYLGDISVHIDTRYKVERIMWSGEYEPPLMRFLRMHNTAGWTCLDVGANVGAVALALAKYVGAGGKVYAFEPGPPNQQRLRRNLALNSVLAARVEVLECGVGERPGELWWAEEAGNPGNALLSEKGTHEIPVITLDDFLRERPLDRVDFVKIDVEGMELQVMHGSRELLRAFHPTLYFETLPRYVNSMRGATIAEFRNLLEGELGYELFRLSGAGEPRPLQGNGHSGYTLAVHPSRPLRAR
jgi:FkbM family methyltransferase